jgi:hypothetical protein
LPLNIDSAMRIGAPDQMTGSALEALRSLRSRYPTPTNATALAALDGVTIPGGPRDDGVLERYVAPDGILPRMRLLAWGWTKQGDRFKSPSDTAWWKATYQYPLWNPLETLVDQLQRQSEEVTMWWDDDLAHGDKAELSRSYASVLQSDLPPVNESPCPKWIIPPGRGQLPLPNPTCLKDPVKDIVDVIHPPPQASSSWWWLLVVGALMLFDDDKRSRR